MRSFVLSVAFVMGCGPKPVFDGHSDAASDGDTTDVFTPAFVDAGLDDSPPGCHPDPGNFDVPGNGCDDDGNGIVDDAPVCDQGLSQTASAIDFAKAIGLCQQANGTKWGVVSARYTTGYQSSTQPNPDQHGVLTKFGDVLVPRQGSALGVLSSGYAQEHDLCNVQGVFKGGCPMTGPGTAPPGFPKQAQGCPPNVLIYDVSDVQLVIKVPNNAKGFSFDFDFGSGEWPEYVCTPYNDSFIAYLHSAAYNNGQPDNIAFDAKQDPVSVNNGFFDRCSPQFAKVGCAGGSPSTMACPGGDTEMHGTGFYDPGSYCNPVSSGGGMTGWLTTQSPVVPGETITIDLMIWDTGDMMFDSSVLLDDWTWQATETTVSTGRPPN